MNNPSYELLGLLIKQPSLIHDCQLISKFEDPFSEQWQNFVFQDIKELYSAYGKIDRRELMKKGHERNVSIEIYKELIRQAGYVEQIKDIVYEVHQEMVKRKISVLGLEIQNCQNDELATGDDYLQLVRKSIEGLEENSAVTSSVSLPEAVKEVMTKASKLAEGNTEDYLKTGVLALDRKMMGFTRKTMSVIGARPSIGKTALGLTIQSNMDLAGIATGMISVEMSEAQCVERIMQVRSGVSIYDFARGNVSAGNVQSFSNAGQRIAQNKNMQIERTTDRSISNIRNIMRQMKAKNPNLAIIFIDYIQKLQGSSKFDMRNQITEISGALTDLANDLNIHVCCLAQINRTGDDFPKMKDLKESGAIEQDAHYIILIHRDLNQQIEGHYNTDVQLFLAKNRDGETGIINCKYNAVTTRFYDDSHDYYEQQGDINL